MLSGEITTQPPDDQSVIEESSSFTTLPPSGPDEQYTRKYKWLIIVLVPIVAIIIIVGLISFYNFYKSDDDGNSEVVTSPTTSPQSQKEESDQLIRYDLPKAILSGTILQSPGIAVTVFGPNKEVLSEDRNDFGVEQAEFDGGDNIILFTIADPKPGVYAVVLSGSPSQVYTLIISYADDKNTQSITKEGVLNQEGKEFFELARAPDGSLILPPEDLVLLLTRLNDVITTLPDQQQITPGGFETLSSLGKETLSTANLFQSKATELGLLHESTLALYNNLAHDIQAWTTGIRTLFNASVIHFDAGQKILGIIQDIQDTGLASEQ